MKLPGRNTLSRRIAPGIWEDADGNPHISVEELLVLFDVEDTPENRLICTEQVRRVLMAQCPEAKIIERDTTND